MEEKKMKTSDQKCGEIQTDQRSQLKNNLLVMSL